MFDALQSGTTTLAQVVLVWLGTPLAREGDLLRHDGGFVAQVDASCTAVWPVALLTLALAVAAALARPTWPRVTMALGAGVVIMALANQVRLVLALWVGVHAPAHFQWVHVAAGPLLMVAVGTLIVHAMLWGGRRDSGAAPAHQRALQPAPSVRGGG